VSFALLIQGIDPIDREIARSPLAKVTGPMGAFDRGRAGRGLAERG
jgi:hypothetical protein